MKTTRSADGTPIAYDVVGSGPPLVLVDGAWCHRGFGPMPKLAPLLAPHFTVVFYDRRGRGGTVDTAPYAVEREVEDLRALFDVVGGEAFLYGTSSGAVLAARAAGAGLRVKHLALYEPPLALDGTHHPQPADYIERMQDFVDRGAHGEAAKLFMRVVGVPAFGIFMMRLMPSVWKNMTTVAPSVMHDFAILGDTQRGGPMPDELAAAVSAIRAPATLMAGSKSPPWMHHAIHALAERIPGATTRVVAGQDHNASAKVMAATLLDVFRVAASAGRVAA